MKKIYNLTELSEILTSRRTQKKIVFTNGCFDLLHLGHVKYLQEARSLGDLLVVGINTDTSVQKLKGLHRPIQPQQTRSEIIAALECVNFVILFDELTPLNLIKTLKPHLLVKGEDWSLKKIVGSKFVLSYQGEVKILKFIKGHSTTSLIEKIKNQEK